MKDMRLQWHETPSFHLQRFKNGRIGSLMVGVRAVNVSWGQRETGRIRKGFQHVRHALYLDLGHSHMTVYICQSEI